MEKEKITVTGVNSFVGRHLAHELHESGLSVVGIGCEDEINPDTADYVDEYHSADLAIGWPETSRTRAVIHLAGAAGIAPLFEKTRQYKRHVETNNSIMTNLCQNSIRQTENQRVVVVSGSDIYKPYQPMSIAENGQIDYCSPEGASKVLVENQTRYYRDRGLDLAIVRPFDITGPGQDEGYILPDLYNHLASLGQDEHATIDDDIESRRDFTDVRDAVRAFAQIALAEVLRHNVYNVCSGKSVPGQEIFYSLKDAMNLNGDGRSVDQSSLLPDGVGNIVGNPSRIKKEFGWKPEIDIQQSVADFVESRNL